MSGDDNRPSFFFKFLEGLVDWIVHMESLEFGDGVDGEIHHAAAHHLAFAEAMT